MKRIILHTVRQGKRLVVAVVGLTLLLIGIVMIVTPGPAVVVIPLALGILATEFVWAKNLLKKLKDRIPGRENNKSTKSVTSDQ